MRDNQEAGERHKGVEYIEDRYQTIADTRIGLLTIHLIGRCESRSHG